MCSFIVIVYFFTVHSVKSVVWVSSHSLLSIIWLLLQLMSLTGHEYSVAQVQRTGWFCGWYWQPGWSSSVCQGLSPSLRTLLLALITPKWSPFEPLGSASRWSAVRTLRLRRISPACPIPARVSLSVYLSSPWSSNSLWAGHTSRCGRGWTVVCVGDTCGPFRSGPTCCCSWWPASC